jgi:hypothetical protein
LEEDCYHRRWDIIRAIKQAASKPASKPAIKQAINQSIKEERMNGRNRNPEECI